MVAGVAVVSRTMPSSIQEPPKTTGRKPFSIAANATGLTKVMPVRPQAAITTGTKLQRPKGLVLQRGNSPRQHAGADEDKSGVLTGVDHSCGRAGPTTPSAEPVMPTPRAPTQGRPGQTRAGPTSLPHMRAYQPITPINRHTDAEGHRGPYRAAEMHLRAGEVARTSDDGGNPAEPRQQ